MDIVSLVLIIAAAAGSFWGGRRTSNKDFMDELLTRIEFLEKEGERKDTLISELTGKLGVLESLVTQRAEVGAVHEEVKAVHSTVQKIAAKLEV